jgi:uncharacterized repeat protein (TIGR04076 family)
MNDTKIIVKVVGLKGNCNAGHKVGDEFEVTPYTASNLCGAAYHSIYPYIVTMTYGGKTPWQENPNIMSGLACPDGFNLLTMELKKR